MNPYVVFLVYLAAILGFVAITLALNAVLGPKSRPSATKLEPFECGATPVSTEFFVPQSVPAGNYSLVVIANGIASDAVSFDFAPILVTLPAGS